MTSLRWRVDNVFVIIDGDPQGGWRIEVVDYFYNPVTDEKRREVLAQVNAELSSLRRHIWHNELGK